MKLPVLSFLNLLLAALPLLLVLILMAGRGWKGSRAGGAGWLAAALVAVFAFGAGPELLLVAAGRSLLLSLFVLYIIWMALLFYHIVRQAGVIKAIGQALPALASTRHHQVLLLAWVFGSFLQGATGFGVPAAVVAPLLVGLGLGADAAVVAALVGHAWAVTFGSLGSSFVSLMAATGQPGALFAGETAILLGLACAGCGAAVLHVSGGRAALRQGLPFLLGLTLVMAGTQWGIATAGLWSLAAFGGGLMGLAAAIAWLRWQARDAAPPAGLLRAFGPYLLLTAVILLGSLPLKRALALVELNYNFAATTTAFGWETAAGPGRSINLFGHAGALLFYASGLTYLWLRRRGDLAGPAGHWRPLLALTVKRSRESTLSIITLVAMAVTMSQAGMTQLLAEGMSAGAGGFFAFLSPFIGALGAVMTGSNTNSNVVFGALQQETALALGLPLAWVLALQTAGGAIGSLFAPAKVVVGCSTVEGADTGRSLRLATLYGVIIVAALAASGVIIMTLV